MQHSNNTIPVGTTVKFGNHYYVVLADKGSLIRLIAPNAGNAKKEVARRNVTVMNHRSKLLNFKGKDVIVTPKGYIISMVSERLLLNTTPDGRAMLRHAARQS